MPREGHLQQAAQDHTKMASEDLQGGGRLHHLSEQPMPVTRKGQKCVLMFRGSPVAPTQLQQKGRITSLGLLATLPLMQPWRPPASFVARAHCWLLFNLAPTRTFWSFSAKLLSNWLATSMSWCLGLNGAPLFATRPTKVTKGNIISGAESTY